MQGYKTYLTILLSLLGSFGVFEKLGVTRDEVAEVLDLGFAFGFGVVSLYLNYLNHKKMV